GIFSFLPQAQEEDVFAHFSTPHGLSLEGAAALFGGHYTRAENWETLRDALSQAQDREGWSLIEVPSNRDENLAWHRALWKTVAREWAASTL
ncbi:MAG: 2-succinyl-5-enolpyruvyl-6-hydroxy-3-cyclohexene-1-carboxylic-acid synthase, partial [Firmicutes bacterium]|nr:2-succinyl-5-enolpyruvyl-6-hydroxy-3-cyclohexene-1-carboxylic-acid synthase [Bacillota bacterium]